MPATLGSMTAPANTRSTRGVSAAASASRLGLRRLAEGEPAAEDLGRAEAYGVSGDEADPPEHEDYEGEGAPDAPSDGEHTLVQRAAASSVGSIAHETRDLEHEPCTGPVPVPVPAPVPVPVPVPVDRYRSQRVHCGAPTRVWAIACACAGCP